MPQMSLPRSSIVVLPVSPLVVHHVNDYRAGQNQDVIGTRSDVHTIGIGYPEPLLRDLRYPVAALVDLILVIQDIALCFHVLSACYVHVEALAQRRDQGFLDRGEHIAIAVNAIRILDVHDLLLDGGQFVALHILKAQVLPYTEGLAINKEDALAQPILNPVVIAECHELLPHAIAMAAFSSSSPRLSSLPSP